MKLGEAQALHETLPEDRKIEFSERALKSIAGLGLCALFGAVETVLSEGTTIDDVATVATGVTGLYGIYQTGRNYLALRAQRKELDAN